MSGSLESARAKIRRAEEHRDEFQRRLNAFLERDPYRVAFEFDSQGWHNFIWEVREVLPSEDLGLIFGDILTNLRSALDYLAWQLVLVAGNTPGDRTQFPILESARIKGRDDWSQKWASVSGDRLKGVERKWVDEIERLQPYKRSHLPKQDPLAILELISNINKHRTLPVAITTTDLFSALINVEPLPVGETFAFENWLHLPIKRGALAMRFRIASGVELRVEVNHPRRFRVAFSDPTGFDWGTNDDLIRWVAQVVAIFEPAFPTQRPGLGP